MNILTLALIYKIFEWIYYWIWPEEGAFMENINWDEEPANPHEDKSKQELQLCTDDQAKSTLESSSSDDQIDNNKTKVA